MIAGAIAIGAAFIVGEACEDGDFGANFFQWLKNTGQFEIGSEFFGSPIRHVGAVWNIDECHAARSRRRSGNSECGRHGFEQRQ
jgi:hypothetical protein